MTYFLTPGACGLAGYDIAFTRRGSRVRIASGPLTLLLDTSFNYLRVIFSSDGAEGCFGYSGQNASLEMSDGPMIPIIFRSIIII